MPEYTGNPNVHPKSEFAEKLVGTCLCGSIRVTINDSELFTRRRGHLCHCANCRKTGGTFAMANLNIEEEKVVVEDLKGTQKVYDDMGGSGKPIHRVFCGTCGNPIASIAEAYPGRIVVKMGMFPRIPDPEYETFGEHRHEWEGRHPGMKLFKFTPAGPTIDEEPAKENSIL